MTKLTLALLLPLFLALSQVTAISRSPIPSPSPGLAPSPSPSEQPGKFTVIDKKDYGKAHVVELAQAAIFSYFKRTHDYGLRLKSVLKAEYRKVKRGGNMYDIKMNVWQGDPDDKNVAYNCVYRALLYWNRNLPKHKGPFSADTIVFYQLKCEKIQ